MNADRIKQQPAHKPRHPSSDDSDLLILLPRDEGRFGFFCFEVSYSIEPGTVRVVNRGKGVALAEGAVLHVERG